MTARKQIKKQHKLEREGQRRAVERSRTQQRLIGFGAAALTVVSVATFAFAFAPWSGSEAEENLPSVPLAIGDNFFRPETLRIKAGQKYRLELRNEDLATHDVWFAGPDNQSSTRDDIRSNALPAGTAASLKIKYGKPGTYYFVCTFHARQGGTLIVEEPVAPERSPQ